MLSNSRWQEMQSAQIYIFEENEAFNWSKKNAGFLG
jgi:hypothetical protein